jgi:hypothetical protein
VKLPAVCLAATFAGGVALGLFSPLGAFASSASLIRAVLLVAVALLFLSSQFLASPTSATAQPPDQKQKSQ